MSPKMPEKKWVRQGYERPEWLREGYLPAFHRIRKGQLQRNCWYCNKPIAHLALVLEKVRKDSFVWFHVGCFKKENRREQRSVDVIGKWHAIYGQVERTGDRGISLPELVAYCRISRSFVKKYLVDMVNARKFSVVRGTHHGHSVEKYFLRSEP